MTTFFDVDLRLGRPSQAFHGKRWAEEATVEDLKKEMLRLGVDKGLVRHISCKQADARMGNRLLWDALAGQEGLFPCYTLLPEDAEDIPSASKALDHLLEWNAQAVALYPSTHGYALQDWCVGPMLNALETHRLPTLLEFEEIQLDNLHHVLKGHPNLPVILLGVSYRVNRSLFPLLRQHSQLHMALSPPFSMHQGIEELLSRFGSHRFLWGTGWPEKEGGAAVTYLMYSDLTGEDRANVAGSNLLRLMKESRETRAIQSAAAVITDSKTPAVSESLLADRARRGEKLEDILVIDAHTHVGPWTSFPIFHQDAESMLRVMDRMGVHLSVVSGMVAMANEFQKGNDTALAAAEAYPGRFKAYATPFPNHPSGSLPELERCLNKGAAGIKIHTSHGKPYDHDEYMPVYQLAHERELPILAHTWGQKDMEILGKLADAYPKATFISAHAGARDVESYIQAAKEHPNLYLETCTSITAKGLLERFCSELGPHKLLFGSDMVFISLAQQIGKVLFAEIPDEGKRLILGENARRIFRLG